MREWIQKYEDDEEETEKDILNARLNRLINFVDNVRIYKVEDMIRWLSNIVELYEKLRKSGFDFDEKDMIFRKKQLARIKYKKLEREYMESKESESWNDYREEEKKEENER